VKEIERWANHPKAVEVFMSTAGPLPLGHRSLHPIYEAAAAHKLPVAAHTTVEGKGNSGPHTGAGYASRYLEYHTGLASTSICNTASLVCEGVFEKFPDFQFVLLEGGGFLGLAVDVGLGCALETAPRRDAPAPGVAEHLS
jgi:predicted TIM-barrel fold metal-dependent hydrolase